MKQNQEKRSSRSSLYTSVLLLLIALVSVTAATTAWLTLADHTRVYSMMMDVNSGANLRFDLDPHEEIYQYVRSLNFDAISERILMEKGYDPRITPLMPVTTDNCTVFSYEDGEVSDPTVGDYMEFTLHFIASQDLVVHLTSSPSADGVPGTAVTSSEPTLPAAMRISFTDGENTVIYDPGIPDMAEYRNGLRHFGLPDAGNMTYSDNNALFSLTGGVDKPITVRIWMEGTDPECDDDLQEADYAIRLRFEATDENNNVFDWDPRHHA